MTKMRERGKATEAACRWILEHHDWELSLGSAVVAGEWVDAHDLFGPNR